MTVVTTAPDRSSTPTGIGRPTPPPMPAVTLTPTLNAMAPRSHSMQPHPTTPSASAPSPVRSPRILISLATYNEAENIRELIAEIRRYIPDASILVVDDNSPDGTGKIVDELAAADPRIHVLHRPRKLGLGTATLAAMQYAIENGYDFLQNMDADFSHPPRFLPNLIGGMDRHDVMVGSRYVPGGGSENWPLTRQAISRTVNGMVRFLFRMPVNDASGAYRCYRVSMLEKADLTKTASRGYSFQQEVLFRIHKAGAKLGETPIIFENRRAGKSKVNWQEAVRSMAMILWIGVNNFFGLEDFRPRASR